MFNVLRACVRSGTSQVPSPFGKCCLSVGLIEIRQQSMRGLAPAHSRSAWSTCDVSEARLRGHVEKKLSSAKPYKIRRRSAMGRTSAMLMPCGLACGLGQAESRARFGNLCFSIELVEIRQQSIQGLAPARSKSKLSTCDASEASRRGHVEKCALRQAVSNPTTVGNGSDLCLVNAVWACLRFGTSQNQSPPWKMLPHKRAD